LRYKKITYGLKRSEFCINEQTGKEDYQTQDRKHRHLPYSLWHIIAESNNDYLKKRTIQRSRQHCAYKMKKKQNKNTTQYALVIEHPHTQTGHTSSHKQLEAKTNRTLFLPFRYSITFN
jgi:hypothetical protein